MALWDATRRSCNFFNENIGKPKRDTSEGQGELLAAYQKSQTEWSGFFRFMNTDERYAQSKWIMYQTKAARRFRAPDSLSVGKRFSVIGFEAQYAPLDAKVPCCAVNRLNRGFFQVYQKPPDRVAFLRQHRTTAQKELSCRQIAISRTV
ncbi:hypothetical protein [Dysosmobacter sp.]